MLSSIGNSQEPTRHIIPLTVENPEVGQNFHDHENHTWVLACGSHEAFEIGLIEVVFEQTDGKIY